MRTSYHSVSSARQLSSWLLALLGLASYVGLIYVLTLVPLQFEVPLPKWAVAGIPPVTYGLLVWLWVRRPSVVRWLVGTAVLSGLHVLLAMSREPLSALLDPALAGRALPWMLPPPLPELIGVMLLLVPLRDLLHAPARLPRERSAATARSTASVRVRAATPTRAQAAPALESSDSFSEAPLSRNEPAPEPVVMAAPVPPVAPPPPAPVPDEESRRRRAAVAKRRREAQPARTPGRSEVVLRIALDRVMDQFPPGTFLAPEDEVAASLRDPGFLQISGELVVTQLSEGVARVAWSDIADQFPAHLVGLSSAQIVEHLGEGLRLPLDEVIGQLPHELFVADTPAVEIHGLHRIPVPFHPVEESDASTESAPMLQPEPEITRAPEIRPAPVEAAPVRAPVPPPAPAWVAAPPAEDPDPIGMEPPAGPEIDGPTVRISWSRVATELPVEAFHVPLDQVAERLREPGALLIPQSVVLPQLAEGLIRVGWDVVARQFPREAMAVSDAEMAARLPNGIRLPLDEIIRQVPLDLFTASGPAADVRGLEYFPAPFQPLLSDPAPEAPVESAADPVPLIPPVPEPEAVAAEEPREDVLEPVPALALSTEADPIVAEDPMVDPVPAPVHAIPVAPMVELDLPLDLDTPAVIDEPEPVVAAPSPVVAPAYEPPVPPKFSWPKPAPVQGAAAWTDPAPSAPIPTPLVPGPSEAAEARRLVALLAPIASFDVSVQAVEGVTVFAMASPTVAHETAVAVAGLALPLFTDRRPPWPVDQITLRGPGTAVVLTPLGGPGDRGSVLAAAAPRGGALALLEILCRRAAGDRAAGRPTAPAHDVMPGGGPSLAPAAVPSRAAALTRGLNAFGDVSASVLRDSESEAVLYFFLPAGDDVPAVGAFAQDLHAVMRKAAGSGAVFRTAILRSGDTLLVIQPEEIGHGRSIVIVAGGPVTRPGLAYRQVERAAATLMSA